MQGTLARCSRPNAPNSPPPRTRAPARTRAGADAATGSSREQRQANAEQQPHRRHLRGWRSIESPSTQIDDQARRRLGPPANSHDPEPADFDESGKAPRRASRRAHCRRAVSVDLIVGDETRPRAEQPDAVAGRVDQPQRQVRLSRPRRPEDQDAASAERDAGGVAQAAEAAVRPRHQGSSHRGWPGGGR